MNGDLQNIDAEGLRQHYRTMWRIRALEQMALKGFDEKLVLGAIHPSIGQEAVAAGVIACLDRDDLLLSTHRGHGHTLAKGASSTAMMRELLGREGGNCGGKGGSMHIADFAIGMLGANGVVAANIVIAAGAAHAIKLRGESRLVVCFFGDGAINRGPFLEGLNCAAVFKLPVLFVCEDNGYAATTRTATMTAGGGPSVRARALGVAAEEVDGNDVLAVAEVTRRLLRDVRNGAGPRFLHAHTWRTTGHTGADPATYRSQTEVESFRDADPLKRAHEALLIAGVAAADLDADRDAAEHEMLRAYDDAKLAPFPPADIAFTDVQDIGSPLQGAY
jgi:acetoin:2,6-dichlorophenolindophenol oxidoreductase subunit alpha